MRRNVLFGSIVAGAFALTMSVGAQTPANPQTPPQPDRTPTAAAGTQDRAQTQTVRAEGCLKREADVPGRKPNVAERAGVSEDYILTGTKMVRGSAPAGSTATGEAASRGTAAASMMYQVKGLSDDELKSNLNKRVQIEGKFEDLDRATAPDRNSPNADLVDLRGTTIKQISGTCE